MGTTARRWRSITITLLAGVALLGGFTSLEATPQPRVFAKGWVATEQLGCEAEEFTPPPEDQFGLRFRVIDAYPFREYTPPGVHTVRCLGPGRYVVRFRNLGVQGGVVHVTASEDQPSHDCKVGLWFPEGSDLLVNVNCFAPDGRPEDSKFYALFYKDTGRFRDAQPRADGAVAEPLQDQAPEPPAFGGHGGQDVPAAVPALALEQPVDRRGVGRSQAGLQVVQADGGPAAAAAQGIETRMGHRLPEIRLEAGLTAMALLLKELDHLEAGLLAYVFPVRLQSPLERGGGPRDPPIHQQDRPALAPQERAGDFRILGHV